MTTIALEQTQTTLAELIHRLTPGEEVIIVENDRAVARLVLNPLPPTQRTGLKNQWPCKAGSAKNTRHWMASDFDAPLDEFKEYME
ncbi:MAG: type II toxin-antitoxin system prevent-host-death family antitoxin [Gammaproteobacteria bacterium]|nr:type II toxin-antitoxin system prevent-host-death family antitoxin [Gammaproteobacteria bacterium]